MSKLYTSLELSPENFLHLQAAAKSYMLDPEHPERGDCVGQRGKGDSELVKMKLWNCAARFLDEGNGQSHFAEDVLGDEGAKRTMFWPGDRSRIIGAVIPLLRRMVTNERQRQYAVESRKGLNAGKKKRPSKTSEVASDFQKGTTLGSRDQAQVDDLRTGQRLQHSSTPGNPIGISAPSPLEHTPCSDTLTLQFNILRDGHRVRSRCDALAQEYSNRREIYAQLLQDEEGTSLDAVRISVLLPHGLTVIGSDDDWFQALSTVQQTAWMDGEVKVLIELPT